MVVWGAPQAGMQKYTCSFTLLFLWIDNWGFRIAVSETNVGAITLFIKARRVGIKSFPRLNPE
jgi:hypothetical protein